MWSAKQGKGIVLKNDLAAFVESLNIDFGTSNSETNITIMKSEIRQRVFLKII